MASSGLFLLPYLSCELAARKGRHQSDEILAALGDDGGDAVDGRDRNWNEGLRAVVQDIDFNSKLDLASR